MTPVDGSAAEGPAVEVAPTTAPRAGEEEAAAATRPDRGGLLLVAGSALLLVLLIGGALVAQARRNTDADLAARQAEVAQRGAHVMPFDQDRTTHRFESTTTGGTETVTVIDARATDSGTTEQVRLIRDHLTEEQARFAAGDFTDPQAIHGADMPGVADLTAGARAGTLVVTYEAIPDGARLVYEARTPELVEAVHRFFDAQLADHGTHATN